MKARAPLMVVIAQLTLLHPGAWSQDPAPFCPQAWTLVHMPDTQNYVKSASTAPIFTEETRWIADQKQIRNIRFMVQVGDLSDNNGDVQWGRARASLDVLSNEVPFACCTGNHDCGPGGSGHSHESLFTLPRFFGLGSPYQQQLTFRGYLSHPADTPGNTQNSWHEFTVGRQAFLILACEWGPRDQVISWMDSLVADRPYHRVILVVHAYMETGSSRFDWAASPSGTNPHASNLAGDPDGVNDGQELWTKLVSKYENFCLVCCGHAGRGFRTVTGLKGNFVNEMLYNTQDLANGGDGWLRLLEFYPDGSSVHARTYSPHRDEWDLSAQADFRFSLSPVSRADIDGDRMPDYYEVQYGLNKSEAVDAAYDADNDGATNFEEFIAGTDPANQASKLSVDPLHPLGGDQFEFAWTSVPGKRYWVQVNSDLGPAGWSDTGSVVTATGLRSTTIVSASQSRMFFRLKVAHDG